MPLEGTYRPSRLVPEREQAERYVASGGADANTWGGQPIVVLTTVGVRTGALRKTPLMRVEHAGQYAAVASQAGSPTPPHWYRNILGNPHVELQDGLVNGDYIAREAEGHERAEWWARALEVWPLYADYQEKTERLIQVFVLDPMQLG